MTVVKVLQAENGQPKDVKKFMFFCPGCKMGHAFTSSWKFNGDFEKPTVNPSILVQGWNSVIEKSYKCHSFITNGEIRFLGDCTHDLKNTTVRLKDF